MKTFVKGKLSRVLARVIVVAFVFPMLGTTLGAGAAHAQPPDAASVIVFTLDNKSGVGGDELAERVTDALKMALEDSGCATVMSVHLSSPTVQRAITVEKSLTEEDFVPPVSEDSAGRIAQALGVQFAFAGVIEAYRFDEEAKQVSITLTVHKIEAATGDATTIKVVGRSGDHKGSNGKEGPLMTEAIDNAVYRVVVAAFGPVERIKVREPVPTVKPKKSKTKGLLAAAAVLVAILLFAKSGGAKSEKAAPRAASPVTHATGTPTASSVQLSWQVASGTTVGGFNIYRAPVTGSSLAPARGGGMGVGVRSRAPRPARQTVGTFEQITNLAGSARSHSDTSATAGHLYTYQIRALVGGREATPATCVNTYNSATTEIGPGVPQTPTGVTASAGMGVLAIMVQWAPNQEPFVTSYRVYRATSAGGPFAQIAEVSDTQYNNATGLTAGVTYYYKVGAVGAVEAQSAIVSAVAQTGQVAPPSNLQGFPEQDRVRLTWDAPADPSVVGYNIYRNGSLLSQVTGIGTTVYTDTTAVAGQTYTYTVRSRAADGSESDPSNTVTVGPSDPADNIDVSAQPGTIVANGTDVSTLSALVTAGGNPVGGASVTFETDHGTLLLDGQAKGDTLNTTTNTAGIAQCQLRSEFSTVQVIATVTASTPRAGGGIYSANTTVTMVPAVPASIEVTVSDPNPPGDGTSSITVTATVKDQSGAGVAGVNVVFSILPELGAFDPTSAVTNVAGVAQTTLTSTGGWGSATITATADSIQGTATINFTPPPTVTVSVNPDQLPAGGVGNIALITATVKYLTGEPAADGTVVRFGFEPDSATTSATGARIAAGEEQATTVNGLAYSHLISAPNLDEGDSDFVIAFSDRNGNGVFDAGTTETKGTARVTYTDPPFQVTVTADPGSIPADGITTSKIVADVRTAIPNPIGPGLKPVADGTPVRLTTTLGSFLESGTAEFNTTTLGGLALGYLQAGTVAGTAQVTATSSSVSGSVEVPMAPVADYTIEMDASPGSIEANGTDTSTITIRIVDSSAYPQPNVFVTFTSDLGAITPSSAVTDASGQATTVLRAGYEAGTASVVCRATALDLMGTKLVTIFGGEPAFISTSVTVPNLSLPATNGLPSPSGASPQATIYARVTDKYGNAVRDGTQVQFTTDIGQITASAPTTNGLTNATLISCNFADATNRATYRPGVSSTGVSCDTHGGKVTDGPFHIIFSGDFALTTFAGSDTMSNVTTKSGGDFRTGAVGGFGSEPNLGPTAGSCPIGVTVLTYDQNNNHLPVGIPVSFTAIMNGVVIASGTGTTSMVNGIVGAGWSFTPTTFPNGPMSKAVAEIGVGVPAVVNTSWGLEVSTWVGAAKPAGTVTVSSPAGNTWQVGAGNTVAHGLTGEMQDAFNNWVQNGNQVNWSAENVVNVSYQFLPAYSGTTAGKANTILSVTLLDPEAAGGLTVKATAAADPDVSGTFAINVVLPPP